MNKKTVIALIWITLFVIALVARLMGLWITEIQRRINYLNEFLDNDGCIAFNYENLVDFRTKFNNGRIKSGVDINLIYYEKRAEPFFLTIDLKNINENIDRFEISKCNIIYPNGKINNILDTSPEKKYFSDWVSLDLPINYKTDDEITLNYEINIYLKNEIKTYIFENHYKRVIEEKIILPPTIKKGKIIDWYEITLDEYNKNIKKSKIRRLTK